jgi:putative membrane protein insertion efficiency factor
VSIRYQAREKPEEVADVGKQLVVGSIKVYQHTVSRMLPPSCRFYPSCSQYAVDAVEKYGVARGLWLAARRLSRCHPFNPGGYDPVK